MKYERRPVQPLAVVDADRWLGIGFLPRKVKAYTGWEVERGYTCPTCGRYYADHGIVRFGEGRSTLVHPGWFIIWTDDGPKCSSPDVFERSYRKIGQGNG